MAYFMLVFLLQHSNTLYNNKLLILVSRKVKATLLLIAAHQKEMQRFMMQVGFKHFCQISKNLLCFLYSHIIADIFVINCIYICFNV